MESVTTNYKLKLLILVNNFSITTATGLAHLFSIPSIDVVGVVTIVGFRKKKNIFNTILYSYKNDGLKYIINKIIYFFKSRFALIFKVEEKNNIYFCLEQVKRKHSYNELIFSDINSNEAISAVKELSPDIIFSFSFPFILKEEFLSLAKLGNINLHRSLLPKYRGCNPVFWVRAYKEKETGITIHHIEKSLDTGNIILQKKVKIGNETNLSIMKKFSDIIPSALDELFDIVNVKLPKGDKQNNKESSSFKCPTISDRKKFNIWD